MLGQNLNVSVLSFCFVLFFKLLKIDCALKMITEWNCFLLVVDLSFDERFAKYYHLICYKSAWYFWTCRQLFSVTIELLLSRVVTILRESVVLGQISRNYLKTSNYRLMFLEIYLSIIFSGLIFLIYTSHFILSSYFGNNIKLL